MQDLNKKAETMFEHMKDINHILTKKATRIEDAVTNAEQIFMEELTNLMNQKKILRHYGHEATYNNDNWFELILNI